MVYQLYGREVFQATTKNGKEFTFTCYGQSTSYGFRHLCCLGYSDTTVARYVKGDVIAKACYYNGTWERFKYETVLSRGIENLTEPEEIKAELKAILIDKRAQKEHEECERQIKAFEALWNGLSEQNKEHIRNGVGENGIQSEDQANAVTGVMKLMTALQN